MQAVRQQTLSADYAAVFQVVEGNPAYPFPGFGNTFPHDEETIPNSSFSPIKPLDFHRELNLQIARINFHKTKLVAGLSSLAQINDFLVTEEHDRAREAIVNHKISFGLSFALIKKELLLALQMQGLSGLSTCCKALMANHQPSPWSLYCHYVYDLVDPSFSPVRALVIWRIALQNHSAKNGSLAR